MFLKPFFSSVKIGGQKGLIYSLIPKSLGGPVAQQGRASDF